MQVPDAVVLHEGSGITGRRSDFTTYHGHRNRIWTYLRDMPLALLLATAPLHLLANLYLIPRLAVAGVLRPYLRALRDGVRGAGPFLRERGSVHRNAAPIASALTWSPFALVRRRPKVWNVRRDD